MGKYIVHRPETAALEGLLEAHGYDAAATAIRLAWQAGLMRAEIAALTWDRVSFLNQEIELPDRNVPFCPELEHFLTVLSQRQDWKSQAVLLSDHRHRPMQPQPISLLVRAALDEVGQNEVRLLDLRYDFIIRQLETHDWQHVSRITGMESAALNQHFAPYLSEGTVSTRIVTENKPRRLDEMRLRKLLRDEGGSEIARTIWLAWQAGLRLSDIAELTWGDVRLEAATKGDSQKLPKKYRSVSNKILITSGEVPISLSLSQYLETIRGDSPPEEHVVLSPRTRKPMLPDRLSRVVRTALIQAGLDNVSLLDLQRDHALRAGGEDVILGRAREAGSVTRNEVMALLGVTKATAYTRLTQLVQRGSLTRIGARYYPADEVVPRERQFQVIRDYLERFGVAYRQDIATLLRVDPRQCTVILNRLVTEGKLVRDKQKYTLSKEEFAKVGVP